MLRRRNITMGEILAENSPNTREKVIERWAYLKSEYKRSRTVRETSEIWKGMLVIIASALWFMAIIIMLCLHT